MHIEKFDWSAPTSMLSDLNRYLSRIGGLIRFLNLTPHTKPTQVINRLDEIETELQEALRCIDEIRNTVHDEKTTPTLSLIE